MSNDTPTRAEAFDPKKFALLTSECEMALQKVYGPGGQNWIDDFKTRCEILGQYAHKYSAAITQAWETAQEHT